MLVDESLRDELARAITHPSKLLIEAAFQKQRAAKQALYDHHRTLLFEPIGRKAPQFCGPLGVLASSILPRHSVSPVVVHGAIREIVQLYYIGSAVREWQHVDRDGHVYGWECSISLYHIVSPSVGCQPCLVDVVQAQPRRHPPQALALRFDRRSAACRTPGASSSNGAHLDLATVQVSNDYHHHCRIETAAVAIVIVIFGGRGGRRGGFIISAVDCLLLYYSSTLLRRVG